MLARSLLIFFTLTILTFVLVALQPSARADVALAVTAEPTVEVAQATEVVTEVVTEDVTEEATEQALVGDPARGEDIFRHGLYGAPPCVSCHSPTVAGRGSGFSVGPGLKGISERGATRIDGLTAPEYVMDSIRHPAHYVVSGYNPIMPTVFGEKYSDQDIADLAAFLMTL